jgi:hypothetical protein
MVLKKGQKNNPNGRKKGVPNKSTQAIKEVLSPIISNRLDTLDKDLEALKKKSLKDYIDAISKLMPYVAAKHIDVKGEVENKVEYAVKRTIIKKNADKS